jgi:hypothetical protein
MKRVKLSLLFLVFLAVFSAVAGGQVSLIRGNPGDDSAEGIREPGWVVSKGNVTEDAKGTEWGRPETLADHYRRHGADFEAKSAKEYAKMASDFFVRAKKEKLPTKIATDGTIRIYDRKTNTFGAYNPDGTTKTFFKPKDGQKYWNRQ